MCDFKKENQEENQCDEIKLDKYNSIKVNDKITYNKTDITFTIKINSEYTIPKYDECNNTDFLTMCYNIIYKIYNKKHDMKKKIFEI